VRGTVWSGQDNGARRGLFLDLRGAPAGTLTGGEQKTEKSEKKGRQKRLSGFTTMQRGPQVGGKSGPETKIDKKAGERGGKRRSG